MTTAAKKKIESDVKSFATRNFVRPAECKNLEQIRFYVKELCLLIEDLETKFDYVPADAYTLLAQYNTRQNDIINTDFRDSYCR
ncbi:MAG TPA: hypothetical protein VK658_13025 [Chryseolinea sp.]|nr:hypothetical protein [Chryseolinea sp.]